MEVMIVIWLMSLKNGFGLINVLDFYIVGTFRGVSFLFKNHHCTIDLTTTYFVVILISLFAGHLKSHNNF